jgi:hypothetical protein
MIDVPILIVVWWSLAVLSALVGVMAVLLEYFGIIRDLGLVIGVVSTALMVLFGLTASTRTAGGSLRNEIVPVLERIERILIERRPRGLSP